MLRSWCLVVVIVVVAAVGATPDAIAGSDSGVCYYTFPPEMQRAYDLPGDRRFEGYGARGVAVTENQESPLYRAAVVLRGSKVVRVDSFGKDVGLIYEWQFLEVKDAVGDMVYLLAENNPPAKPTTKFVFGSGKYAGITGGGDIGWGAAKTWPDGSVTREFSLEWEIPDTPAPIVVYEPQPGDRSTPLVWAYRYPHELDDKFDIPDGRRFDHHDEDGFILTPEDPDSPFHETQMWATTSILFAPGGGWSGGMMNQWAMCELMDTDGDQIFMYVVGGPDPRNDGESAIQSMIVLKGTGKFDGIQGGGGPGMISLGSWPGAWPGGPEINRWDMWWTPSE